MSTVRVRSAPAVLVALVALLAALVVVAAPGGSPASAAPAAGSLLYLRSTDGGFSRHLYLAEGGSERRLSGQRAEGRFSLSPSGDEVVFAGPPGNDDTFGRYGLYRLDIASGALRQITAPAYADRDPAWSPDGSRLAFRRAVSGRFTSAGSAVLTVSDANGAGATAVPGTGGARDPAWSPDGSRLAYVDGTGVWTVAPDGSGRTLLSRGSYSEPAWSPDGGRVAVVERGSPTSSRVMVLATSGGGFARPAAIDGVVQDPRWSADGGTLFFVRGTGAGVEGRSRGEVWSTSTAPGASATRLLVPPTVPHHLAVVSSLPSLRSAVDVVALAPGGVRVRGWVVDPASPAAALTVRVVAGGRATGLTADGARSDVGAADPVAGPDHGFDAVVPRGAAGPAEVCLTATSADGARTAELGCTLLSTRRVRSAPRGG